MEWPLPANPEPPRPGVVHVWSLDLDACRPAVPGLLSADELQRAARFRLEADRRRFARTREALRVLLGAYARTGPRGLQFSYGRYGKPRLDAHALEFSVAHAESRAVFAIATDRCVGVDIERVDRRITDAGLTSYIVSARDYVMHGATLAPALTAAELTDLWTKKEAAAKAVGVGMSAGAHRIVVGPARGDVHEVAVLAGTPEHPVLGARACGAPPGFVAAVAAPDFDWTIQGYEYPAADVGAGPRPGSTNVPSA